MSTANEDLLRHFLALWAVRDVDGMVACFAEDGVYDNVPTRRPMVGRAAIRAWLEMCFGHLTRIDVGILTVATRGEWVLCERLDEHIIGERHMPVPVMGVARIVDGRISLFRDYYDTQTVKDLGMG